MTGPIRPMPCVPVGRGVGACRIRQGFALPFWVRHTGPVRTWSTLRLRWAVASHYAFNVYEHGVPRP